METVEVVIRLSKRTYDYLINLYKERGMTDFNGYAENAIANGIVLPERHGKLVDADKLGLTDFEIVMCDGDYKKGLKMLCEKIENAPTILDAKMG